MVQPMHDQAGKMGITILQASSLQALGGNGMGE